MSRSIHGITGILIIVAALTACSAGRDASSSPDPCEQPMAIGKALLAATEQEKDAEYARAALAQHVVDNPACYSAELVAKAQVVLTKQNEAPSTWAPLYTDNLLVRE